MNVGDRVEVIQTFDGLHMAGKQGTVLFIEEAGVLVEFDETFERGHSGLSNRVTGRAGCCRWGDERELKLINEDDIALAITLTFDDFMSGNL